MKTKPKITEAMFFGILEKILPTAAGSPELASSIYDAVSKNVRLTKNFHTFEDFCEQGALADFADETLATFKQELEAKFGADTVNLEKNECGKVVDVELSFGTEPWMGEFSGWKTNLSVRVDAAIALAEETKLAPWVPFPFAMPGDPDNVWLLARRENFGPDEAARALTNIEAEFWETRKGLQLQKKHVEKCFANFIEHVASSALKDSALKRHYKVPEVLKVSGGTARTEIVGSDQSGVGSQQQREKSVAMTAQMYEIRDTVRRLMRDEYHACMFGGRKKIEACMKEHSLDALHAMMKLSEAGNADGIIAAYVEMFEPSQTSA